MPPDPPQLLPCPPPRQTGPVPTEDDLEPGVRAILGTPAAEGAGLVDQPACCADPRVTAQLTDDRPVEQVLPWRIDNAEKGHVLVVPGGPSGLIGGLLSQVHPPQSFSHVAIMTRDRVELRHVTFSEERLRRFPHRAGTEGDPGLGIPLPFVPALNDAPTDGFQELPLRHGWPGTITQTVERAYMASHERPTVTDADGKDAPDPAWAEYDPHSGRAYFIDAITLTPAWLPVDQPDGTRRMDIVWPLVVKPCQQWETDRVRDALDRVADAARALRGHYRFYAYTRAEIGLDDTYNGVVTLETTVPDTASPCTGRRLEVPTPSTRAMVCSSFVWLAVQAANTRAAVSTPPAPRIILDGRPDRKHRDDDRAGCPSSFVRHPLTDEINPSTRDGLYFYRPQERLDAAKWLYDRLRNDVLDEIADATDLNAQLDQLIGTDGPAHSVWSLLKLLSVFTVPQAALLLGISSELLSRLVVILTDMPSDVANQMCNALANDDCQWTAKDSDQWTSPGEGYTVSPDDIVNFWAPPTYEDDQVVHGLYGSNDRIRLKPPEWTDTAPPPSAWTLSLGSCAVYGTVTFQGQSVAHARVRIGSQKLRTGQGGTYSREGLPEGLYWAEATYRHPVSGLWLTAPGRPVRLPLGGAVQLDFELHEPPDSRREVVIGAHMDLVNRYAIGTDWWDHPDVQPEVVYLGLDYFPPDNPAFAQQREHSLRRTIGAQRRVDDWGNAEYSCDLEIQADRSIRVTCRARLKADDDDPWQQTDTFDVPPKANEAERGYVHIVDLVRSPGAWPVRAHIELTIHNNRA